MLRTIWKWESIWNRIKKIPFFLCTIFWIAIDEKRKKRVESKIMPLPWPKRKKFSIYVYVYEKYFQLNNNFYLFGFFGENKFSQPKNSKKKLAS